jgi:hypothetical protein
MNWFKKKNLQNKKKTVDVLRQNKNLKRFIELVLKKKNLKAKKKIVDEKHTRKFK